MKARFLRSDALEQLRSDVLKNLDKYRYGDFSELTIDVGHTFEFSLEIEEELIETLKAPADNKLYEVENCRIAFAAMRTLTPYEARDERLWAYLCHTSFLQYARARWTIPEDDDAAAKHILKHFFAKQKRQVESENAASRLWWMAFLCSRAPLELSEALDAFLYRADVRASMIERPTTSQSEELFGAILRVLVRSYSEERVLFERDVFRRFMREINSVGGAILLDCLQGEEADALIAEVLQDRLQLVAL